MAISTNGCIQSRCDRYYFRKGLSEFMRVLRPDSIVSYSNTPKDIFTQCILDGIERIQIENDAQTIRRKAI